MGAVARTYTRNGITMVIEDVMAKCPGFSRKLASARLRKWEKGKISLEQVFAPPYGYRAKSPRVYGTQEYRRKGSNKTWTCKQLLKAVPNLGEATAYSRLRAWSKGKLTDEELVKPPRKYKRDVKQLTGQVLTDEERRLLDKIPGPTKYEKEVLYAS